jgi:hypothetical protein
VDKITNNQLPNYRYQSLTMATTSTSAGGGGGTSASAAQTTTLLDKFLNEAETNNPTISLQINAFGIILREQLYHMDAHTTGKCTLVMNGIIVSRSWHRHNHRGSSKWYVTERKKPSKHRFQPKN